MIMRRGVTSIAVSFVAVGIGVGHRRAPRPLCGGSARLASTRRSCGGNDFIFAFPALLIAIMLREVFGPGAINAIVAIGIFNIPVFARVAYGAALPLWTRDFIMAARVAGKGPTRITIEHILPNILRHPDRAGDDPAFPRHPGRGGAVLCRARGAAADAELGPHAERGADADGLAPSSP